MYALRKFSIIKLKRARGLKNLRVIYIKKSSLGGYLADYIFEPMMTNAPKYLTFLVGTGKGSGMAVMFLCTGVLGSIVSLLCYLSPHVRALEKRKSS